MHKYLLLVFSFSALLLVSACERDVDFETEDDEEDQLGNIEGHDNPDDYLWEASQIVNVELSGSTANSNSDALNIDGAILSIQAAGTYRFTGTLDDGQLRVDTDDDDIVRIILDGARIHCSDNAPIYVEKAFKVMIVMADSSLNSVSDGELYSTSEQDANAAIYSEENLTIFGNGTLHVNGNYQDGICSKDGLLVASGTIVVNAADDGMRGKDYVFIKSGNIEINAGGDGIKSDNEEDDESGYFSMLDGSIDINSGGDGIQVENSVSIEEGQLSIVAANGNEAMLTNGLSGKGIKSGQSTLIAGGNIHILAADDAIHSDGSITIDGGVFSIASGDDGIHAEADLTITDGDITILDAYEGLESALGSIVISDGFIDISASDDGINVSAGGTSNGGGPGRRSSNVSLSDYALSISGGTIVINCEGDGLDSNDLLEISGGTMFVNSASNNENSALDYDGDCIISGGLLLAIGVAQMAKAPGTSSTQNSFLINFASKIAGGNLLHIEDENGNSILTYQTIKAFDSVVLSSPSLSLGKTYHVYIGGSSTGSSENGYISDGIYTGGQLYLSITLSNVVSTKSL